MINKSYLANSITTQLSRDIQSIRDRIDRTSSEAVTGRTADPTAHLSGQIGRAMVANDALNKIDRDTSLLQLRESRLDITQQSLSRMQEGLAEISVRALDSLSAGSPVERTALAQDARAQLDGALIALNSRHGERFLFSGDATDKAPFGSPDDFMADLRAIADAATDKADFNTRLDAYFDLDTGDFVVPDRAMLQRVFGDGAIQLTIDAGDKVKVERRRHACGIVIGGLQHLRLLDPVHADQQHGGRILRAAIF